MYAIATVALPLFIFLISLLFLTLCYTRKRSRSLLTDWPVFGMLPGLLNNRARVFDFVTEILKQHRGTFFVKGPVFGNMDTMITCDPANINYILCKNFPNFGKGPGFKDIFAPLGDGIFIAESELWENQRRLSKSAINHASFYEFVAAATWRKLETGLIPILEHFSDKRMAVDLQDLFKRFTFDCFCITILGHDPASLSIDLPHLLHEKAFSIAEEAGLYRHLLPGVVWKTQKWLQIGREGKLSRAMEAIDEYISYCISLKHDGQINPVEPDILTSCSKALAEKGADDPAANIISKKVLKDLMLNLIFAGKDTISATLTWLFWLLATNPAEEEKIRNEVAANSGEPGKWTFNTTEGMNKLIYLHGAVCEALRLFPPVAAQHKSPLKDDVLPSGHLIKANTRTFLIFYSMGRMESIWGEDCLEFKPGRWISKEGRIKVEPAYKFTAFNAGPKTCLGKDVSFLQMKMAAAAMISRFKIEVAEGHLVQPSESIILHMRHGLNVKVSKYA
ncbi:alkane hydroxylase MAH1-like [Andrographis paniculata]|uniref:alkane hydroxylase MAH1-like n=1 Tax=Andrographis paniculata TaxID=175694 RepID=UPI0021E92D70|nr:alkane hydroxylase MAH1-like [Andrographis paniculata]